MRIQRRLKTTCGLAMCLAVFTSFGLMAMAQNATVDGLITGRSGLSMSVKTADSSKLTVLLSDTTKATEKGGFLGLGRKDLNISALVPGLFVKVEGAYDPDHQLIAKKVTFSKSSFTTARQIDAGLNPVKEDVADAKVQLKSDRKDIEQSQQDITKNSQDIDTTKQGLATTTEATSTNTQAVGRANERLTSLDQYEAKDSITVNFAIGKSTISKKDEEELTNFVKEAANTPGYMIEVQGYASVDGPAAFNQRLSQERADAVLAIIQQSGVVPMTRILAPAAMGTTNPVATERTRKARAQNRRVVVTVVVNKGITG